MKMSKYIMLSSFLLPLSSGALDFTPVTLEEFKKIYVAKNPDYQNITADELQEINGFAAEFIEKCKKDEDFLKCYDCIKKEYKVSMDKLIDEKYKLYSEVQNNKITSSQMIEQSINALKKGEKLDIAFKIASDTNIKKNLNKK